MARQSFRAILRNIFSGRVARSGRASDALEDSDPTRTESILGRCGTRAPKPYVDLLTNLEPFRADLITRLRPSNGQTVLDLGTVGEPAPLPSRAMSARVGK